MEFLDLINLIDHGRDSFYTHISFNNQSESGELQFQNHRWRYRQIAYQGEWIAIPNPKSLKDVDFISLRKEMVYVLLTEYCYWEMVAENPNEIRKQTLLKFFGAERCKRSLEEMKQFQKALVSSIQGLMEPKNHLTIVKE